MDKTTIYLKGETIMENFENINEVTEGTIETVGNAIEATGNGKLKKILALVGIGLGTAISGVAIVRKVIPTIKDKHERRVVEKLRKKGYGIEEPVEEIKDIEEEYPIKSK